MPKRFWEPWEFDSIRKHWYEHGGLKLIIQETGRQPKYIKEKARVELDLPPYERTRRNVQQEKWKDPAPVPVDALKTGKCPGVNKYGCGHRLYQEPVQTTEGYTADDCVAIGCGTHRWLVGR